MNTITGEPRSKSGLAYSVFETQSVAQIPPLESKSQSSISGLGSPLKSPNRRNKRGLAVWDALILADQDMFQKEQQRQAQLRRLKLQETQNYNRERHNQRK